MEVFFVDAYENSTVQSGRKAIVALKRVDFKGDFNCTMDMNNVLLLFLLHLLLSVNVESVRLVLFVTMLDCFFISWQIQNVNTDLGFATWQVSHTPSVPSYHRISAADARALPQRISPTGGTVGLKTPRPA